MDLTRRRFVKTTTLGTIALSNNLYSQDRDENVISKTIPANGEQLPVIGFGTNRYGTGSDPAVRAALLEVLEIFHSHGGRLLDTSSHYRGSETVLGSMLAELELTDNVVLSTKAGKFDEGTLENKMNNSLISLGLDQIDFYAIHNAADQDWQTMLPKLQEWKQEGRIRYLGVTTSEPAEHEEIAKIMRTQALDFVQLNYNLADRSSETELLPIANERGLTVIGNVPFGQGALFSAVNGIELPDFAKEFSQSWGNFFLKYNVSHPQVTASIPGTTKPHHALDNMQAGRGRLPTAAERKMQEQFIAAL